MALAHGRMLSTRWSEDVRLDVVMRLADADRTASGLARVLVEAPDGPVPLRFVADVVETESRNRIEREDGRRRVAVSANLDGDAGPTVSAVQRALARLDLPPGYRVALEGTWFGQADAARTVALAGAGVLVLIVLALLAAYRSLALTLIVLTSAPLALIGAVAALLLAGLPLSLASTVGFVTLIGIALRNSILKVSHTLNLHLGVAHGLGGEPEPTSPDHALMEGMPFDDALILRASRERLAPVLMTALAAIGGLLPLLAGAEAPGKEILYPVAVVVVGGLVTSTLLDTFVVPLLLRRLARGSIERLRARRAAAWKFPPVTD
jgi:HME family heavy-metal exporter